MKYNTPILLSILFIALSIWLSFSVKNARQEVVHLNSHLKVAEQELQLSKYQKGILQEALELNIGKAPVPTRLTTSSRLTRFPKYLHFSLCDFVKLHIVSD